MLTELQKRIVRIVLSTAADPDLVLAGGAALITKGIVERTTADLDFFTTTPTVEEVVGALEQALIGDGLIVETLQRTPTFARLVVSADETSTRLDVAQDIRLFPPETGPVGRTVATDELVADKVLALFARARARDFVDLYWLAELYERDRMLELAAQKDLGFDRRVFAEMLGGLERLDRDEFEVDDETFERLRGFVQDWRRELSAERS